MRIVPSSASAREVQAALIIWFSRKIAPTARQTGASRYETRSDYVLKNGSHPTLMVLLRLYDHTPVKKTAFTPFQHSPCIRCFKNSNPTS